MDKFLIALSYLDGLGPKTALKLIASLGSPEEVFTASFYNLTDTGLNKATAEKIIEQRQKIDPDKILNQLIKEKIQATGYFDDSYPLQLKETSSPPLVLFYRGNVDLLIKTNCLAVVGSRKISSYIKTVLPKLLEPIIAKEVVIVSGLAYGVDALAHELALENNGPTIAVLGSGLGWEFIYPKGNLRLAKKIYETNNLLISEFPPYTPAITFNFPRRNRIIAGLAKVVLIAEASEKSGALITASYAAEEGRDVLAIPQNINSATALGVNRLISQGAKIICTSDDLLDSLNIKHPAGLIQTSIDLTILEENEKIIYKTLSYSPLNIDKIIQNCTLEASVVGATLMKLELRGLIKNLGGQNYIKN